MGCRTPAARDNSAATWHDRAGAKQIRRSAEPGRRTIIEMMAKDTHAGIVLATADLDAAFARLQASGAEIVQEPTDQPYGVRDCAVRDPARSMIRIQERRRAARPLAVMTSAVGTAQEPAPSSDHCRRRDTELMRDGHW
jgi:hypothetical protein